MGAAISLSTAFLAGLPDALRRPGGVPSATPEDRLRGLHQAGRAAWPAVEVAAEDFITYLAERLPARAGADPVELLDRLKDAADLYLACGCVSACWSRGTGPAAHRRVCRAEHPVDLVTLPLG